MRPKTGSVSKLADGRIRAQLSVLDRETGKRRYFNRKFRTRGDANHWIRRMLNDIEQTDGRAALHEGRTFSDLADYYERHYLHEPQYTDGRRIAGLRSWRDLRRRLATLREAFGPRRLRSITHGAIVSYRAERLQTPVTITRKVRPRVVGGAQKRGGKKQAPAHREPIARQRSVATVNRELALFRRVMEIAQRESWILVNPFKSGDSLISAADERQRERILTLDEERLLLAACDDPTKRRQHLRPILVCALDTGMRRGEMFRLRWSDIDFDSSMIAVRAENTKTLRSRTVRMTARLALELIRLKGDALQTDLVFGIHDTVKTAWNRLRSDTGLAGLRFHDLRHTAASRLARSGLALAEIGRLLGHTQPQTTYRYVNADHETARRASDALDRMVTDHERTLGETVAQANVN